MALEKKYFEKLAEAIQAVSRGKLLEGENLFYLTGLALFVGGTGAFVLFRWTRILIRESEAPFRYTFWVEDFRPIEGTPAGRLAVDDIDRMRLLSPDIAEKLKRSLDRLLLLPSDPGKSPGESEPYWSSHIRISGTYTVREEQGGTWKIQVMPRVCIGAPGSPEYPAPYVRCAVQVTKGTTSAVITAAVYERVVEEVYSRIAGEIYRQIRNDVAKKITALPTHYLRAVALFHEAEDFSRSNTADGYDLAVELYREAKDQFLSSNIQWISRALTRVPTLWRLERRFALMDARTRIGFARCVVYRRILSELSGRRNPGTAFEARTDLGKARKTLETLYGHVSGPFLDAAQNGPASDDPREKRRRMHTAAYFRFPHDNLWRQFLFRPDWKTYQTLRASLLEAYVVSALFSARLGAYGEARSLLDDARSLGPDSGQSPSFLLAEAESIPEYQRKLQLLRQATDLEPTFEIAQYLIAHYSEMRFRQRDELEDKRVVELILDQYDTVRKINPGNVVARIARGFLLWISNDLERSEEEFRSAQEISSQASERFTAPLNYGLARIAAEKGDHPAAYDYIRRALSADPAIATFTAENGQFRNSPYNCINAGMLRRFARFKDTVSTSAPKEFGADGAGPDANIIGTWKRVYSFVLNDYGNALLNYYHQFGNVENAWDARDLFEEALRQNPEHLVANCNLANVHGWLATSTPERIRCLRLARHALPDRVDVTSDLVLAEITLLKERIATVEVQIHATTREHDRIAKELKKAQGIESALQPPFATDAPAELRESRRWVQGQDDPQTRSGGPELPDDALVPDDRKANEDPAVGDLQREVKDPLRGFDHQRVAPDSESSADPAALEAEKYRIENSLKSLRDRKETLQNDLLSRARTGSREILLKTTLAPWLRIPRKELGDGNPDGAWKDLQQLVALLDNRDVQWERMNESDASAILRVASVWSACGDRFQRAAADIIRHSLVHFWPENFDAYRILVDNPLPGPVTAARNETLPLSKSDVELRMKEIVEYWLGEQPYSYSSMHWYLNIQSGEPEFCGRRDDLAAKAAYINSMGNAYTRSALQVTGDDVGKQYRLAINAFQNTPVSPERHFRTAHAYWGLKNTDAALREAEEGARAPTAPHHLHNLLGILLFQKGRYRESAEAYRKAIDLEPTNAQYRLNLSEVLRETEELLLADEQLKGALQLAPEKPSIQQSLGRLRQKQNDPRKAVEAYRRAVELDSDNPEYYCDLGLACHQMGEIDDAILQMNEAVSRARDDSSKARYSSHLGDFHYLREDYENALEAYRSAVIFQEDLALFQAKLGRASYHWREFQVAQRAFKRASELEPQTAQHHFEHACVHTANKEYGLAIGCFEEAIRLKPDYTVAYSEIAALHRRLGQWEHAANICKRGIAVDGTKAAVHWNDLGNVHFEQKQYELARDSYQKAVDHDQTTRVYHANLALALQSVGLLDEAAKVFERAVTSDPDNATNYLIDKGEMFRKIGEKDRAADTFREAIRRTPSNISLYLKLADCYWDRKEAEAAEEACKLGLEALKANPSYDGFVSIAHAYRLMGKSDRALDLVEAERLAHPENAHSYFNLKGVIHFRNGHFAAAAEEYRRAKDLKPEPLYHSNLGEALRKLDDLPGSVEEYRKAAELSPKDDAAINQLGNVFLDQGKFIQAIEAYRKAIQLRPGKAVYYSNLAGAHRGLSELEQTAAALQKALKLDPENHQYHSWMGKTLFDMGAPEGKPYVRETVEEALESDLKAIQINPKIPDYFSELCRVYRKLDRPQDAIVALAKAQDLDPAKADEYMNLMGVVRFEQKNYPEAIRHYTEAIRLKGGVALYHSNLGIAFRITKQAPKAIASLERALTLMPQSDSTLNNLGLVFLELTNEYDRSIEQFSAAIKVNPKNHHYHSNLAIAWEQTILGADPNRSQLARRRAIASLQSAIALEPNNEEYGWRLVRLEKDEKKRN